MKNGIALAELSSEIAFIWLHLLNDVVSTLYHLVNIVLTILTFTYVTYVGVGNIFISPTDLPLSVFLNVTVSNYDLPVAVQVTRTLLLVSGDVEANPGPDPGIGSQEADSLTLGLALLLSQATSEQVKSVIGTWAPDKPNIVEDLNKFKVPALKETLAALEQGHK